ncbi:MAG: hypothetical protein NC548_65220 [Lachnospiraceae bacterium]|nr:hypothetical protein [Lachnospiraceae bacterium]
MKNFGTLYRYELKKLLKRKLAWIVVLVLAAFMAYTAWPIKNSGGSTLSLTDQKGQTVSEYVSAAEQGQLRREGEQRISGLVMDEKFFQRVREVSVGNGLYIIRDRYDLGGYFYLVDSSYYMPYSMIAYDMGLDPAEITAESFYQNRLDTVERQWNGFTNGETA